MRKESPTRKVKPQSGHHRTVESQVLNVRECAKCQPSEGQTGQGVAGRGMMVVEREKWKIMRLRLAPG